MVVIKSTGTFAEKNSISIVNFFGISIAMKNILTILLINVGKIKYIAELKQLNLSDKTVKFSSFIQDCARKDMIVGAVWGIVSIFGAISGMIYVSGMQRSVTGSWILDAIIFLPATLSWLLTKILPENIITGLIVLFSPILIGALIGCMVGRFLRG